MGSEKSQNLFFTLPMKKILVFVFILNHFSFAQRIEPSNWWVGMKNPEVQLLIHFEKAASYTPSLSYPGVTIKKIHKADSPNYLFIDLHIAEKVRAGNVKIRFKGADSNKELNWPLLEKTAIANGFNSEDAIYLITPDRFSNGNPNNDNVEGYGDRTERDKEYGRHGGDIQGIINHLDYIHDLGFTAIWPMPLEENKMDQWSYHGYAITDYYSIDPRFGTLDEYLSLSTEAKKKGIKIIKDVVLNHCGSGHWWMQDKPFNDWINFQGKYTNTNHRREVHRDPHASEYDKKVFSDGWFVESMPDLNQKNPFMAKYLIQNSIWWIEKADLGGFRVDTYPYSDKDFLSTWSKSILEEYPNFSITSEEWSPNPAVTAYWQLGKENADGYKSYVSSPMDFPTQMAITAALMDDKGWNKGLIKIYESLANDFLYADPSQVLLFLDNHDMSRIYTSFNADFKKFKLALVLLATLRGIPQFYYGTELAMHHPGTDSHGYIRSDFPGGWAGDKKDAKNKETLSNTEMEAQTLVKTLFNFRKNSSALKKGKLIHFAPEDDLYVYFRIDSSKKVMVVLNKNDVEKTVDLKRFSEIQLPRSGREVLGNSIVELNEKLKIPPMEAWVLELN